MEKEELVVAHFLVSVRQILLVNVGFVRCP
jgi:hypothetical protein